MATQIHPTAIVDPGAGLGVDCVVGPYCHIGPEVTLGDRCKLHSHVVVDGNTAIGHGGEIFPFACLGKQTQDLKYRGHHGRIEIGSHCTFREYVTVHMPTSGDGVTQLGADCSILAYCHIAHDCRVGDGVVMSNSTHLAGHVTVEDHAVFGGLIGVHQFSRIGAMAMIGTHSKIVQDIVPFSLADGSPALPRTVNKVGMQRNGVDEDRIRAITRAHKILFRSKLSLDDALARLEQELGDSEDTQLIVRFVRESERGIARPKKT